MHTAPTPSGLGAGAAPAESSLPGAAARRRAKGFRLPREHGFWTMLVAAWLCVLLDARFSGRAWLPLAAVTPLAVLAAGFTGRAVRKSDRLQVLSAAVLGAVVVPLELAAGVPAPAALMTGTVWTIVFVASALLVRGAFERSRRRRRPWALWDPAALAMTALTAAGFAWAGRSREALALGAALTGLVLVSTRRPTVKQMKPVGLALAGIAGAVLVVLALA